MAAPEKEIDIKELGKNKLTIFWLYYGSELSRDKAIYYTLLASQLIYINILINIYS